MGENSKIEWTTHTFNPWLGCTKVSLGCANCYAEAWARRSGRVQWGPAVERRRTSAELWRQPLRWNAQAQRTGERPRVFCASLADVFDPAAAQEWRADLWRLIDSTPALDWLLLTKRIGAVAGMVPDLWLDGDWPAHVWLGITVCNQVVANRDIPQLLELPAPVRFLSCEPLLGPLDLRHLDADAAESEHLFQIDALTGRQTDMGHPCLDVPSLDWVIVGGESGPRARPMHPAWVRDLRDQCSAANVPFLFKQWGEWREPLEGEAYDTSRGRRAKPSAFIMSADGTAHCFQNDSIIHGRVMVRVGKKAAGRTLDGRTWDALPGAGRHPLNSPNLALLEED
ncbi:phage Gp37/Gp68 family protein [Imhoffiella purpurea]|uniref:Bacteriophage protein gp37 n=1 Tax=Imhoffiella purpurea TaxID=1249627 RepID=W9V2P0_9GAMM|nr:phage Gp37/Gp68 family protein [Imhoffiella purpurea]EXJ13599.1 Bacteriophage protein gp37 [Imhoffiella purpurea]